MTPQPPQDITAEVTGWALDELGKQRFGEDYAAAVTWSPQAMQIAGGTQLIALWSLLVTGRNPILGEGCLYSLQPLGDTRPSEEVTRARVGVAVRQLREAAKAKLSAGNGHAAAVAP